MADDYAALPAGFIGVIWTIYRFLSDRELIVMQAVGLSPRQFSKMPILFDAFADQLADGEFGYCSCLMDFQNSKNYKSLSEHLSRSFWFRIICSWISLMI